jgi:maltose O-acetyltransferase
MYLNYTRIKNVKIGNKVFVGAGSIILPGVTIGDKVIVGAGSVVTKNIPDNSVFAGNPAHFICTTESYLITTKSKMKPENWFGEEYTLRGEIDAKMKVEMSQIVSSEGIGFVI